MCNFARNSTTRNFAARNVLSVLAFCFFFIRSATGANVAVSWLPSANAAVTGYIVYYGQTSQNYSQSATVGNITNLTLSGLNNGQTYYFAVTSYDASGNQSSYSQEVSFSIPSLPATPVIVTNEPPIVTTTPPIVVNPVATNAAPNSPGTNTPPTLDPIADISIVPSIALHSVILTGLDGGSGNVVSVAATSSDTTLVSELSFQPGSSGSVGTLIFKSTSNAAGTATVTVTITTDSSDNNTFSESFNVTVLPILNVASNIRTPSFSRKLADVVSAVGKTVKLQATAAGAGQLAYSWKFNGHAIYGANSPTLVLPKISRQQAGLYSVNVSSPFGSISSTAKVTVTEAAVSSPVASGTTTNSVAAILSAPRHRHGMEFSFRVNGVAGQEYIIQASSDLAHWTSVSTNIAPFDYVDTGAGTNSKRYFRAVYESAE